MYSDQQVPSTMYPNEHTFYNNYYHAGFYERQFQQYYPYDLSSSSWMTQPRPIPPIQSELGQSSKDPTPIYEPNMEQHNYYYNQMQQQSNLNTAAVAAAEPPKKPKRKKSPTPFSPPKSNSNIARRRTLFTTPQLIKLEQTFRTTPYVNRVDRGRLATTLGLKDKSIKCWFQNRRMKEKKIQSRQDFPMVPYNRGAMVAAASPSSVSSGSDNEEVVQRLLVHAAKRQGGCCPGSPEGARGFEETGISSADSTDRFTDETDDGNEEDYESIENILHDNTFYQRALSKYPQYGNFYN